MKKSLGKEDVWADLLYALDELERPPREIHSRLTDAANLGAQPGEEFIDELILIGVATGAYSRAQSRANTTIAHEAIEKGLKAILIEEGLSAKEVRSCGHELHRLLEEIQSHSPTVFEDLERCFDSTIQYLANVTISQHNTNIVDYFREHGGTEIFVANRYASIEGLDNKYGMIGFVYREMIRALLSLTYGRTPDGIHARIEEEARKAVLAESQLDPAWDAAKWLSEGPVRPRLEDIQNLENQVLYAAVRRCARKSRNSAIQFWAQGIRSSRIAAKRQARVGTPALAGATFPLVSLSDRQR